MNPELHLRIAGTFLILLALAHVFFPKRFNWREELARLSLLNRQIFYVHSVFIGVVLLMMGGVSVFATDALLEPSKLSRLVLGGFAGFWALRLVFQLFVYDSALWRGDRFNTMMHVGFILLWSYLVATYGGALLIQLPG